MPCAPKNVPKVVPRDTEKFQGRGQTVGWGGAKSQRRTKPINAGADKDAAIKRWKRGRGRVGQAEPSF